jgi:hypothetical protein
MNGAFNPVVIAQAVARNIVPLVGILVFHWSTGNVLILYLLDTLLSIAVIISGLASSFASPPDDEGVGGWINAEAGYVLAGLLVAAFLAVPLGIILAASGFSFREAFNDSSLRGGARPDGAGAMVVHRTLSRTAHLLPSAAQVASALRASVHALGRGNHGHVFHPRHSSAKRTGVVDSRRGVHRRFDLRRNCAGPIPARDAGRRG